MPASVEQRPTTTVQFLPGKTAEAKLVARYLEGQVGFEETADLVGDVTVITGTDFTSVLPEPKPETEVGEPPSSAPSTTTTLPGSTTTTVPAGDATATPPAPDFVPDEVPDGVDCR